MLFDMTDDSYVMQVHDVGGIVERLLEFLEIGKNHVTAETIIQMKDLLRTFPDIAEVCLASISSANVQVWYARCVACF